MPNGLILNIGFLIAALGWGDLRSTYAQVGTIALSDLPEPPPEVAALLKRGSVQFTYGSEAQPSSATLPNGRQLTALTIYTITYDFRHLNALRRGSQGQQWVTSIRPGRKGLDCKHTVWFRERPEFGSFWTNRLVQHELDHVRISSDAMIEKHFGELLKDNPLIKSAGSSNAFAGQAETERHVEAISQQVAALIDVRYQELDRLTDHGRRMLPENSSLDSVLRP